MTVPEEPSVTRQRGRPRKILLFSGKRKSGKDHLTDWLLSYLNHHRSSGGRLSAVVLKLAGPLKKCYARDQGLDFESLMSSGGYKEDHRLDMIRWSEDIRNRDPGFFCREAIEMYCNGPTGDEDQQVWIVSDCRRSTDFEFFEQAFPGGSTRRVRVEAQLGVRQARGFVFQAGIDDAESECGLDLVHHHFVLHNDGSESPECLMEPVLQWLMSD